MFFIQMRITSQSVVKDWEVIIGENDLNEILVAFHRQRMVAHLLLKFQAFQLMRNR